MVRMISLRHIRIRRHQSLSHRLWKAADRVLVDVVSAFIVLRGFWRHRATLLHR
jgi:hypothetical protein